jgi:pimeloyl-ACP methyl ester carboxylesterase
VGESLRTLELVDGRTLAYAIWGDRKGFPVLVLHGTPGCRLSRWPDEQVYTDAGICWITHDRAGYGQSTRRPGRRVVDEVDDVVALADELGLERFGVWGGSGGGPHVLACAALRADRVSRAVCAVGLAPLGTPGLERDEWLAGMDPENVKEVGWIEAGEETLTRELERQYAEERERVAVDPSRLFENFDLSDSDRAEMERPELQQVIRESVFEAGVNGVGGWVDDGLALISHPWGYDVGQITVPVLVRYGATDVFVPPAHGRWLAARVPGCVVKVDDDAGHLGSDHVVQIREDARWLRDGEPPPGSTA